MIENQVKNRPETPGRQTRAGAWWLQPHWLVCLFIVPVYVLLYVGNFSPRYGMHYINVEYFLLGLAFLCVLGGAAYLATRSTKSLTETYCLKPKAVYLDVLALGTFMAYFIWFRDVIAHPELFTRVVLGLTLSIRDEVSTIPGLTTLTQLGVVYSIIYSCYRWVFNQQLKRRYTVYFCVIVALALFRSIAWAERLATIEVVLPAAVVYLAFARGNGRSRRLVMSLGPYLAIFFVIVFFGMMEFFRSWGIQQTQADSFFAFMADRFSYYYYSSINNGAGLLTEFSWPQFDGQFTLKWIYTFPVLGSIFSALMAPDNVGETFLRFIADDEFTTFTGIFPVFYDLGTPLGLLYAALMGAVIGYCYKKFRSGSGLGMMLYPVFFIYLAEILRISYVAYSRVVPIFLFLIIGYWVIHKRRKPVGAESA